MGLTSLGGIRRNCSLALTGQEGKEHFLCFPLAQLELFLPTLPSKALVTVPPGGVLWQQPERMQPHPTHSQRPREVRLNRGGELEPGPRGCWGCGWVDRIETDLPITRYCEFSRQARNSQLKQTFRAGKMAQGKSTSCWSRGFRSHSQHPQQVTCHNL